MESDFTVLYQQRLVRPLLQFVKEYEEMNNSVETTKKSKERPF